jgi:hypothetical protein
VRRTRDMASRFVTAGLLAALLAALVVSSAGAKEGVVARVVTPISRDAEPGSKVRVVWTLTFLEAGERRPFGGGYVFVRLFGPNGSHSARTYAVQPEPGRFRALVKVPRGGVRRVEFGIMGMVCDAEGRPGCHPGPKLFPIVGRVFR